MSDGNMKSRILLFQGYGSIARADALAVLDAATRVARRQLEDVRSWKLAW